MTTYSRLASITEPQSHYFTDLFLLPKFLFFVKYKNISKIGLKDKKCLTLISSSQLQFDTQSAIIYNMTCSITTWADIKR